MNWQSEKVRLRAPICLTWQITNQCNLHCIHCLANSSTRKREEVTVEEIKGFLDDLALMKVFYINMGGGEPLLHPNFFEIVDYAEAKGVYIQFSTNGTLVNQVLAKRIAERGLRVQVSLDGWNQATNDPIRGAGTFAKAITAVKLLREKDVTVSVNCVVTKSSFRGLNEIYQLVNSLGARLRLSRLRPAGRAVENWRKLSPEPEQYKYLYQWLKEHPDVTTGDSFFFLSALGEPLPGLSYCGAGKLTCSVDPQGNIYPCPFSIDSTLLVGNIKEKPLSSWWREAKLFLQISGQKPDGCGDCASYAKCRGGCRGASYLVYGNFNQPDPDCMRRVNNGAYDPLSIGFPSNLTD